MKTPNMCVANARESDTKILFDICAPYVINAARKDGSAFPNMMNNEGILAGNSVYRSKSKITQLESNQLTIMARATLEKN